MGIGKEEEEDGFGLALLHTAAEYGGNGKKGVVVVGENGRGDGPPQGSS
jgi:hypothetical protein